MNIYVGNIPYGVVEDELRSLFESFGEVTSAKILTDRYSGQSRGIGFVEMSDRDQALSAIQGLNGKDVRGRALRVDEAQPRKAGGDRPQRRDRERY